MTPATADVLAALLGAAEPLWGLRVIAESGRPAGSVYPILERLERAGWAESEWEAETDRRGPRRRMYRLTAEGATAAAAAVAREAERRRPRAAARGALA